MAALRRVLTGTMIGVLAGAVPAHADVTAQTAQGFVSRNVVVVAASPAAVWKRLVTPSVWWSSDHTFSGDAANLSLDPVAGGCFCERLPAEDTAPAKEAKPGTVPHLASRGGVEHMRVVYVERAKALRMVGALGPLQSEAVNSTLTVTLKAVEGGTRVIFEYVVGGYMRYPADKIVPAIDTVLANQLTSLAHAFGPATPRPDSGPPEAAVPRRENAGPAEGPPASRSGLGEHGVLLPRGRIWSLPPSETPVAAPLPAEPTIAPLNAATLPTAALPQDATTSGGGKAVKRTKRKPVAPAPEADASPRVAETAPAKPPASPETAAPAPDAAPPPKPKAVKKPVKAALKPAAKPAPTSSGKDDEPSKDAVNSAFDAAFGDEQRPVPTGQ